VRECLDAIRADADTPCCNPVQWRECLPHALFDSRAPIVVAYLKDWGRTNACDEAHVRAAQLIA
jgi:hypothetical protein